MIRKFENVVLILAILWVAFMTISECIYGDYKTATFLLALTISNSILLFIYLRKPKQNPAEKVTTGKPM
jgi:hypothetical protein